eukprot:gnl/MRDRNA2_/MRDRNA2_114209_c0_seq1.p1 gnl/MRDRNA2_/MRDRNA2_114209_c0~~gnl/MRDRNA2_/MRDRNA2_114209_c0_seq1.p1  ORF type:complete len:374 (-),score=70.80 gnl/MRDRNA2_/MRDRNA2_114209_c0_seq1:127-1248(-)
MASTFTGTLEICALIAFILTAVTSLYAAYQRRAIQAREKDLNWQEEEKERKRREREDKEERHARGDYSESPEEKEREKERVYRVRLTGIPTIMAALTVVFLGWLVVRLVMDPCCEDGQPYCEIQVGEEEWVPNNTTDTSCCAPVTNCIEDDDDDDSSTKKKTKTSGQRRRSSKRKLSNQQSNDDDYDDPDEFCMKSQPGDCATTKTKAALYAIPIPIISITVVLVLVKVDIEKKRREQAEKKEQEERQTRAREDFNNIAKAIESAMKSNSQQERDSLESSIDDLVEKTQEAEYRNEAKRLLHESGWKDTTQGWEFAAWLRTDLTDLLDELKTYFDLWLGDENPGVTKTNKEKGSADSAYATRTGVAEDSETSK